jgi:hypothetical protein
VRPYLEALEDRVVPQAVPSFATLSAGPAAFSLFTQTETVTVQVNAGSPISVPVNGALFPSTVTISDGGQNQTVTVGPNGQATATFTFSLFQELQTFGSHPISASYSGFPPSTATVIGTSTGNATAPGNPTGFLFQLYYDYALAVYLGY